MTPNARGLTIGALARETGVNLETVRYYERIGLMPAPARTDGGHRLYEAEHRRRLMFIRRARDLGFGIDQVRALLALSSAEQPCCEVRALAAEHLQAVRAKLADLQRLETVLAETVERCDGTLGTSECAVLAMLDEPA